MVTIDDVSQRLGGGGRRRSSLSSSSIQLSVVVYYRLASHCCPCLTVTVFGTSEHQVVDIQINLYLLKPRTLAAEP